MKDINGTVKLGDLDYTSLAQDADADFFNTRADSPHRLPVPRFESVLDSPEFEAGGTAGFLREVSKIIEA
jgi:hypothetical protein